MSVPIRVRMTVWYAALLAVVVAALGAFLVVRLRADLVAGMDARLRPAVTQIALGYHAEGPAEVRDVSATVLSGEAATSQALTPRRRVVVSYGDAAGRTPMLTPAEVREVLAGRVLQGTRTLGRRPARFRIAAEATTRGRYPRVVVAAESLGAVDRSVHRLLVLLLVAGPAAILLTAGGGWWLARRALRPISRLTTEAGQIGMDRLGDRLQVPGTADEVARLATTLNAMLARIQSGVDGQRRLVADASHELRTPLAAMRAELDVSLQADDLDPAAQDVLRSTREEVDRLSHTVTGLLTLARADQGALDLRARAVDLAAVAGEAVERLRPLARQRGVAVHLRGGPAPARADAAWLDLAIGNLVDNAMRFSPPGGTVTVTTAVDGGEALVRVADEGPGIPPEAREVIFERFQRLDASRTRTTGGSGIGLSIVREIAHAHGGRVWTAPGPRGGSVFTIALPVTPAAPAADAEQSQGEDRGAVATPGP